MKKEETKKLIRTILSQKAMVQLREADLTYLLDETELKSFTYSTEATGKERVLSITCKLIKQCEYTANYYHHFILLISYNPTYPLMLEELKEFHQDLTEDILFERKLLWQLSEDKNVSSLKIVFIMSRKSIARVKELVDKYEFSELIEPLSKLCNSNCLPILQENYDRLKRLMPQPTPETIFIASRWEGISPLIDYNSIVWDEEGKIMMPIALYDSLEKLLSMRIFIDEGIQLEETELMAGVLCDITYIEMQKTNK